MTAIGRAMKSLLASGIAVAAIAGFSAANALDKPADGLAQRPITMIVPYGAGGGMAAIPDFMLAPAD